MKSKIVLFILLNHFTHDSRVLKEARSLIKAGYQVTIRCLWDVELPKKEMIDGIHVERILFSSRKKTKPLLYKLYMLLKFIIRILENSRKFSIIHCHDLNTLPIGTIIKILRPNNKLIYDAHEYETEMSHLKGYSKKLYQYAERFFIKFADGVITVSESIANEYVRLYNITKPRLVLNCPPYVDHTKQNYFREKFDLLPEQMIFLYQGGFSKHRGIEIILEAFKISKDPNKVVVFMGYGPLEGDIQKAAQTHPRIFYHPAVGQDVLLDYTSSADIGILFYENSCLNHYFCSPNKFFEYTMAGLPVIVSDLYEMKRILAENHNGVTTKKDDVASLLEVIENLTYEDIINMQKNVSKLQKIYSWQEQEKRLVELYQSLTFS